MWCDSYDYGIASWPLFFGAHLLLRWILGCLGFDADFVMRRVLYVLGALVTLDLYGSWLGAPVTVAPSIPARAWWSDVSVAQPLLCFYLCSTLKFPSVRTAIWLGVVTVFSHMTPVLLLFSTDESLLKDYGVIRTRCGGDIFANKCLRSLIYICAGVYQFTDWLHAVEEWDLLGRHCFLDGGFMDLTTASGRYATLMIVGGYYLADIVITDFWILARAPSLPPTYFLMMLPKNVMSRTTSDPFFPGAARRLLGVLVIVVLFYEYTVGLVLLFLLEEWFPYSVVNKAL